ncbi:MAG: ERF family protein [Candidatus Dependentiae bacterium]|nr:ERF family protein [Candidatus Dependentiae bacterium]
MNEFQSPDIDQLMLALMDTHSEFGVVINKDRKGHKGTYASLPCVLESIHKMCSKHGLILTQASRIVNGQLALESILRHPKSQQWIACQSLLTPNIDLPSSDQAWGGSITYHRRYDAMALLGIFAEEDPADHDGAAASDMGQKSPQGLSDKQHALLAAKINGDDALKVKILTGFKIAKLADLPWKEFNKVLNYVEQSKNK